MPSQGRVFALMLLIVFFCIMLVLGETGLVEVVGNSRVDPEDHPQQDLQQENPIKQNSIKQYINHVFDGPDVEKKLSAPHIRQLPELPNGCEVTSLTMLLRDAGVVTDKMKLAGEMKKVPFQAGRYMGNPNEGFVGNMYRGDRNHPGFAVYHGPVAELAEKYLGNRVHDFSGSSWTDVEKEISSGNPVWVITSIQFRPVPDSAWRNWHTEEGDIRITFQEHSVLVTGYDREHIFFNDPLADHEGSQSEKAAFIEAWEQFGNQAISIR